MHFINIILYYNIFSFRYFKQKERDSEKSFKKYWPQNLVIALENSSQNFSLGKKFTISGTLPISKISADPYPNRAPS